MIHFLLIISSIVIFNSSASAAPIGFSHGNQMEANLIQGLVRVYCTGSGGNSVAVFNCRDSSLHPRVYSHFLGPVDSRATEVQLTAINENGSRRVKESDYYGAGGRSTEAFNLWISTLFQKPLLQYGRNSVEFVLKDRKGNILTTGTFEAMVNRGEKRTCPAAEYTSGDMNDCQSLYSICQRYFEDFNYCR